MPWNTFGEVFKKWNLWIALEKNRGTFERTMQVSDGSLQCGIIIIKHMLTFRKYYISNAERNESVGAVHMIVI